mgnify:CR=1 FL=1
MNTIQPLFEEKVQKGMAHSSTNTGKTADFSAAIAKEGEKSDITVRVSEGAVGNVEEEPCYGNVSKEEKSSEESDVKDNEEKEESLDESAERLSSEDYEALRAEGTVPEDLSATELSHALERLRLGRERNAEQVQKRYEAAAEKKREAIAIASRALKGNPAAEFIAEKLVKTGVTVTENTVRKVAEAVEFAGSISEMTESMQYYLVKMGKEPTIENVYMARYCAGNVKATPISDKVWNNLLPSVNQMLVRADLPMNEEHYAQARWLTEHGLPIVPETLLQMRDLAEVKHRRPEEIAELAAGAILDGKEPVKADLTGRTYSEAEQSLGALKKVSDAGVERAYVTKAAKQAAAEGVNAADEKGLSRAMTRAAAEDVTLSELSEAETSIYGKKKMNPLEQAVQDRFSGFSMDFDINVVRQKRRLEEIRLKMTVDSAFRLERAGIRLDTSGLSKMVEGLKSLENTYLRYCSEDGKIAGNHSMEDVFRKTVQYLDNLSNSPSYTLGVTFAQRDTISLERLATEGSRLAAKLSRAGEAYETLGTKPQAEYGDSIKSAFSGNAALLKSIGMDATPENLRAVRILAYNSIELNPENMDAVKAYDRKVTGLIERMHPQAALRLIREGINPLTESVDALAARVEEIRKEDNLEGNSEKFARYLFKIERSGQITPEEKTAYIGIFRLFNQLEQTDGAAIGSVLESGKQLTLGNLLSAMRTAKNGSFNMTADESLGKLREGLKNANKIDSQILSGIKIPGKLADIPVNDGYRMYLDNTAPTSEETQTAVQNMRTAEKNAGDAPEFLKNLGLVVTANNVEAAKEFLSGNGEMYRGLGRLLKHYGRKEKATNVGEGEEILSAGGVTDTESLFDVKIAEGFYRNLKKAVRNLEDDMTQNGEPEAADLKYLKQIKMGVKLRGECAGKECFDFPIETRDGLKSMRVTLRTRAAQEEGGKASVMIPLSRLGNVQADLRMEEDRIFCYVSSDSREGSELLSGSKRELTERFFDLGVADATVYCGEMPQNTEDVLPGMDKEGDVTATSQADTTMLLEAARTLFVHMMQLERA